MPDRAISFAHEQIGPAYWANALQDLLSTYVSPTFQLTQLNATTLRVPAGASTAAVTLGIQGRMRYAVANVDRAHPGGGAGVYDVWAVAANDSIGSSPVPFTDSTNYAFELRITATGVPPTISAGVLDVYRKVGEVTWDGAAITRVRALLVPVPLALSDGSSKYSLVHRGSGWINGPKTVGTKVLTYGSLGAFASSGDSTVANRAEPFDAIFKFDPTLYTVAGRTLRLKLQTLVQVLGTVGVNATFGMYPVTGVDASQGFLGLTLGTVVPGSTVQYLSAALANGAQLSVDSADFAAPASGLYALGVVTSGDTGSSILGLSAKLFEHTT